MLRFACEAVVLACFLASAQSLLPVHNVVSPNTGKITVEPVVGPGLRADNVQDDVHRQAEEHTERTRENPLEEAGRTYAEGAHQDSQQHREGGEELGYAICLIGAVAFNMCVFYLANHTKDDIRHYTWQVLSSTVSIFCSVLIYNSIRAASVGFIKSGPLEEVIGSIVLYMSLSVLSEFGLYFLRSERFAAVIGPAGTLCGHIVGFSAMYACAGIQATPPFSGSLLGVASVILLACLFLVVTTYCSSLIHRTVVKSFGIKRLGSHIEYDEQSPSVAIASTASDMCRLKANMRWSHEVEAVENDVMSLCVGFIVMQAVRFAITGSCQPFHPHDPIVGITQTQTNALLICVILIGVLTAFGARILHLIVHRFSLEKIVHHDLEELETYSHGHTLPLVVRWAFAAQHVALIASAWCLLFWAVWQSAVLGWTGLQHTRISGSMMLALFLTFLGCFLIFILDAIADRMGAAEASYIRSPVLALGIVVGFSWERAFENALSTIAHTFSHVPSLEHTGIHIMSLVLCAIVLPAWAMFIHPRAERPRAIDGLTSPKPLFEI